MKFFSENSSEVALGPFLFKKPPKMLRKVVRKGAESPLFPVLFCSLPFSTTFGSRFGSLRAIEVIMRPILLDHFFGLSPQGAPKTPFSSFFGTMFDP